MNECTTNELNNIPTTHVQYTASAAAAHAAVSPTAAGTADGLDDDDDAGADPRRDDNVGLDEFKCM